MVSDAVPLIGAVPEAKLDILEILFGAASGWPEGCSNRSDGAPFVLWVQEAIEGLAFAVVSAAGRGSRVPFAARLETVRKSPFPAFGLAEGTSLYVPCFVLRYHDKVRVGSNLLG